MFTFLQEVKDPRYNAEKMNQKDAKNIFELTNKLETEYTHVISDVIQVLLLFFIQCTWILWRDTIRCARCWEGDRFELCPRHNQRR